MSPAAIALVLAAAVAHASWNLFGKQAAETGAAFFLWLLAVSGSVVYLPVVIISVLVTHRHLTDLNWLFLAGTGLLHAGYFLFLQLGYRIGDLSLAYPIGRGTGAFLAALAGIVLLGERPTLIGYAGILAIVTGVLAIGLPERGTVPLRTDDDPPRTEPRRQRRRTIGSTAVAAIGFALVTGLFIGGYTIWDKYAVSTLHTEPVLQGYAGLPVMAAVFTPFVLRDRARLSQVWRSFRSQALGAAVLSPLAYMLVLVALSFTAVSAVAPAREVSVLFGVLLGGRLLGEASLARRLTAAAIIVAGIIAIALA
jgi:drug/metabolite transporter (DMT)-like permease